MHTQWCIQAVVSTITLPASPVAPLVVAGAGTAQVFDLEPGEAVMIVAVADFVAGGRLTVVFTSHDGRTWNVPLALNQEVSYRIVVPCKMINIQFSTAAGVVATVCYWKEIAQMQTSRAFQDVNG